MHSSDVLLLLTVSYTKVKTDDNIQKQQTTLRKE